jgi:hypothetical protein
MSYRYGDEVRILDTANCHDWYHNCTGMVVETRESRVCVKFAYLRAEVWFSAWEVARVGGMPPGGWYKLDELEGYRNL